MIVEFVWPDCPLINNKKSPDTIDSFWVERGPAELPHVLPFVSQAAQPPHYPAVPCWWREDEPRMHFFLVARDLRSVWPQHRHVLHSSQWYINPFRQLPTPRVIDRLYDLAHISLPDEGK